jgi:murein L,D-transpeptidase YcbB/YkuD
MIEAVVLAPYWYVPETIAGEDKLPVIREDPAWIATQRMTLFDAASGKPVDPWSIDWSTVSGAEFNARFRLRQDPGSINALGNVKFVFPNDYDVFLHDTPTRRLFEQSTRTLSSGCVRLENPVELARLLLAPEPGWSAERIDSVIAAGRETTIRLTEPVPIHLIYFTAFVDEHGRLNFRDDAYNRDEDVLRRLDTIS